MNTIEKLFALRSIQPFDRLRESELELVAEVIQVRSFSPGSLIAAAYHPVYHLYIITIGEIEIEYRIKKAPIIIGLNSLLFNQDIVYDINAGAEQEITALVLSKRHFFTIFNQCPNLLVGFVEMSSEQTVI